MKVWGALVAVNNGNQGAPDRVLLQMLSTRPIANADGTPTVWFSQLITRLIQSVGQTGSSNGTTTSIAEQISQITQNQYTALGTAGVDSSTLGRLALVEGRAALDDRLPVMPSSGGVSAAPRPPEAMRPLAPLTQPPAVATLSADLDQAFGSTWGAVLFRGHYGWQVLAPGTSGTKLTTHGAGADPTWT